MFQDLINALEETLFMMFTSSIFAIAFALPLSLVMILPKQHENNIVLWAQKILEVVIHLVCTIPFIVFMILLIPMAHWMIQSEIQNPLIAVVPLTLVAFPLFTEVCRKALKQVPAAVIETALSLGAKPAHLIFKICLPEALPNIIHSFSQVLIQMMGFSIMAGLLGGGGLGRLLLEKGYQNYHGVSVFGIIFTLILLVLFLQAVGHFLAFGSFKRITK
jgi:D-methionine transport system permease protein